MPAYSLPVHVHIGDDEDWVYEYKDEQIACFLARRHAQQCYSELRIAGRNRFTVMWDSGCTLRGLITEEKAKSIIRRWPGCVERWSELRTPKDIGGISKDQPTQMVAEVTILVTSLGGRELRLTFGVLRGADLGMADAMVHCGSRQAAPRGLFPA